MSIARMPTKPQTLSCFSVILTTEGTSGWIKNNRAMRWHIRRSQLIQRPRIHAEESLNQRWLHLSHHRIRHTMPTKHLRKLNIHQSMLNMHHCIWWSSESHITSINTPEPTVPDPAPIHPHTPHSVVARGCQCASQQRPDATPQWSDQEQTKQGHSVRCNITHNHNHHLQPRTPSSLLTLIPAPWSWPWWFCWWPRPFVIFQCHKHRTSSWWSLATFAHLFHWVGFEFLGRVQLLYNMTNHWNIYKLNICQEGQTRGFEFNSL